MAGLLGIIVGIIIVLLVAGFVIWVVGRMGLGMTVDDFSSAIVAGAAIAVISGIINWLFSLIGFTLPSNLLGAIVALIVSAVVLMLSGRFVKGVQVKGFGGAIIAAIAIGVVTWLLNWVVGLFV